MTNIMDYTLPVVGIVLLITIILGICMSKKSEEERMKLYFKSMVTVFIVVLILILILTVFIVTMKVIEVHKIKTTPFTIERATEY